jgi:polysaccharide chain length determinant protein (PEP-CTERM system associated)
LAVQPNVSQQIGVLSRTLINRPNMEKLSRMADLDHGVVSKEDQEKLIDRLMKALRIQGTGRDNVYIVKFWDTNPVKAERVVQSATSIFVESTLGNKRTDADEARQFIDKQIKIYEQKLAEAENRLKEFKLRNLNLDTSEGQDAFSRMRNVSTSLNDARLALRAAENSRDVLRRQIADVEAGLASGDAAPESPALVSEIEPRIQAMRRNLDTLLQRYTEQHPDVANTRRVIKELEEQKKQDLATRAAAAAQKPAAPVTNNVTNNAVYQKLKLSLIDAEANVAALRTRVSEYEARYSDAKASIQILPEREAEFAQLNRDYGVHKQNYNTFVSRRESAAITGQMDASGGAEFRLIDPPRVAPKPVSPNRPQLFIFALLGALGAGILTAFLAAQVRGSFLDAQALREVAGLPVLGTVSLVMNESMKRKERRNFIGFITGTVALVGSYASGILVLFLLPV